MEREVSKLNSVELFDLRREYYIAFTESNQRLARAEETPNTSRLSPEFVWLFLHSSTDILRTLKTF